MLEKAKNIVNDIKSDAERKKETKEQLKKQQQEQAARLEQERQELEARREIERLMAEKAKIQEEKNALMSLSEKELLVEAVMALRGLYSRMEKLEDELGELDDTVFSLKRELKSVKTEAVRNNLEVASMRLQKNKY